MLTVYILTTPDKPSFETSEVFYRPENHMGFNGIPILVKMLINEVNNGSNSSLYTALDYFIVELNIMIKMASRGTSDRDRLLKKYNLTVLHLIR